MLANVLAEGSLQPAASLQSGTHTLTISAVSANKEFTVQYPDGWHRDHQAEDVQSVLPKITRNLRSRYGVTAFTFSKVPTAIEAGQAFEITI